MARSAAHHLPRFIDFRVGNRSVSVNGTRFAPAYNAAIPKGSIRSSLEYLEEYLELDSRLRIAVVEVHLSDFIYQGNFPSEKQTRWQFIGNSVALFASRYALWSAIVTLTHNVIGRPQYYEIKPGGYVFPPPGLETKGGFHRFAPTLWGPDVPSPPR